MTYDFKIKIREDVIKFIIALSAATPKHNQNYFGFTNREFILRFMIHNKLNKICDMKGLTKG